MAYQLWLDFGAGFVEYTDSLYGRYPMRRQRAAYNDLKPVISTVKFSLVRNTALVTQLLTTSADIPIRILDGETPYFVGYVRPTVKATIDGSRGLEAIEIEAVDLWYKLDRTVGTTRTINGWTVSNPSNKAASLLHQIFYDAGIADSELSLAAVSAIVPSITLTAGSGTYRAIIEQILAEAGYSARVSAAGVVSLYDLGPSTITPVLTLSSGASGNLAAGYKLERKEATAEAVDVEYYVTKALSGAMLFEDTTGATAGLDASISVPAGTYYPNGAASGKSVKAAMRIDGYDLVSASNVTSDIAYNGVLTVQEFAGEGKNILLRLYSASGAVITRLRGYGDAIVKGDLRRVVRENVASTTKREKVEFKYLADDTSAARVARIRALRHLHGAYRWSLTSTELSLTPGDYVSLNEAAVLGASTTLRIVSVVDGPDPKTISVEAEGVAEYTADAVATETETNQPPSPSPAAEAREAAMKSAIELAQKTLTLSAPSISRSRAGVLSPAAVTASGLNADGTAYAGRLVIALSHDGGATWSTVYTSSEDESSHEYTVPATIEIESVVYYVTAVRASLYAAGGTTTLLREVTVPVALDSSASSIYWGALTSAPTSGYIAGDYYFDDNTSASGGGILRYWTGSAWAEMTSAHPMYVQALWQALADMGAWATAQGEVIAAASAIFERLVTANAFIANLFAQQITVPDGGRIRYETGSGVQKRCVQLADEKIDWIDTPDTTPASPEVLRARIGRLGVGGAILMDGEFLAPVEGNIQGGTTFDLNASAFFDSVYEGDSGFRVLYKDATTGYTMDAPLSKAGVLGTPILVRDMPCTDACYVRLPDGRLSIWLATQDTLVNPIYSIGYRVYDSGGGLGAYYVFSSYGSLTEKAGSISALLLSSGQVIVIAASTDTSSGNKYLKALYTDTLWIEGGFNPVSEEIIDYAPSASFGFNKSGVFERHDGLLQVFYKGNTSAIKSVFSNETIGGALTFGDAFTISGISAGDYGITVESVLGKAVVVFERWIYGVYQAEISLDGLTAQSINLVFPGETTFRSKPRIHNDNGESYIVHCNTSLLKGYTLSKSRYARIGAGIIESGGEGCLFGNGLRHFLGRWSFAAYFTPGVWHDVCLIYGRATIMAISSENQYMQPWLINFGWNTYYGQIISATMNPDMGHQHSRDFQWRVVDAGGNRGKLQTAAISYSTTRRITFNVALLSNESSIEWLIGAM